METKKYEVFLKIVEYGSLTKAADALGYTQAGISHILSSMEKEWRVTLLRRDRAGIRLTSEGSRLLPFISAVNLANSKLENQVAVLNGMRPTVIRIGGFTSLASHWLPDVIKTFKERHGGVDFELAQGLYAEIADWLREGEIDIGFLRMPVPEEFDSFYIGRDRLVVVLPEGHRLTGYDRISPDELENEPFLLLDEGPYNEILEMLRENLVAPNVTFKTKDDYAIISMIERGLGIGILPELVLHRTPYKVVVRELDVPAYRKLALAVRSMHSLPFIVREVVHFIQDEGKTLWRKTYGAS